MVTREGFSRASKIFFDHFGVDPGNGSLDDLFRIYRTFTLIPWENLTKFLVKHRSEGPSILMRDPETVILDHVEQGAGGTCFSLTDALADVVRSAGFRCFPVMADMSHGNNIHCALKVMPEGGGVFLLDPGYLVPEAVRLHPSEPSELSAGGDRLVWEPSPGNVYHLYSVSAGGRRWRYRIRMKGVDDSTFRHFWRESFDAVGMNSLHLNFRSGEERLSAHNFNLRMVKGSEKSNLKLRESYSRQINRYFGLKSGLARRALEEWRKTCRDR